MTTGDNILSALPIDSSWRSAAEDLQALNYAIHQAWPHIKVNQYASSAGTFSIGTFEYSLSALTDLPEQYGIARVFVQPSTATDEPKFLTRGWRQYRDDSTWKLVFEGEVVTAFNAQAFDVEYQAKPAALSATTDTLDEELPFDYMVTKVAEWYCIERAGKENRDMRSLMDLADMYGDRAGDALRKGHVAGIPRTYHVSKDRPG